MSDPAERCNDCGLPRREHHHDGAAYGICGQFSEVGHPPSSPGTDGLRETVALALMNSVRKHHGLDPITWDFPAISSWHRTNALRDADAAIAAMNGVAQRPFYGAECPSYPDCNGGCGLGCTKEVESSRGLAQAAIESATNAPPKIHYFRPADAQSSQEPVCWIVLAKETDNVRIWWRRKEMAEEWAKTHDAPLIPLYAHPRCADAVLPLYAVPPSPVAGEDRPYCDPMKQAEAFYLAMYGEDGARWDANENKDIWIKAARNYEHRRRDALAIPSTDREAGK